MGPSRGRAVCRVAVAVMALTVGATDAGAKKKRKELDRSVGRWQPSLCGS